MQFVSDWRQCLSKTVVLLNQADPLFLSRVGGSDTNAVACLLEGREHPTEDQKAKLDHHKTMVKRFNGYYDLADNNEKFIRYLERLLTCYEACPQLFLCNYQMLSMYMPDNIPPAFYRDDIDGRVGFKILMDRISVAQPNGSCFPYTFVEKVVSHPLTLFNAFAEVLPGKRVLVVSPFAESIEQNFRNRKSFFKNYDYPEFTLTTCNTPITYAGLPSEFYPDYDWFETVKKLEASVASAEFDIALLSCGSYALPIGVHISEVLGRKAIYVGGVLQLFFGITGRRYAGNSFFDDQINVNSFIHPIERERFLRHVSISSDTAREAFGAYF